MPEHNSSKSPLPLLGLLSSLLPNLLVGHNMQDLHSDKQKGYIFPYITPPKGGWGVRGLIFKLIDTVNICFDRGSHDVGVCSETIIDVVVVLHLHVYLAKVV